MGKTLNTNAKTVMETTKRLITKSFTWQVCGLFSMTLIGFLFTNSVAAGSGIAIAGSVTGFTFYFLHEMAWARINWGKTNPLGSGRVEPQKP